MSEGARGARNTDIPHPGFTIGNTNTPFFNGTYLADAQDLVVVTVNYRVSVFGFPGGAGVTQNLGLRDQRLAVEWIRDNIASFGGDAAKITIAGQSSGGVAVDYWAYAYPSDPIAHGIIAPSGNAFSFGSNTKVVQESNWNTVVDTVNCSSTSTEDTMQCMRSVPWELLKSAAASIRPARSNSVLRGIPPFWPTPDNEVVFPAEEYLLLTQNGSFAKIPVLLGNTHAEHGYYVVPIFANGVIPTQAQIDAFLLESFTCPSSYQAAGRSRHGVAAYAYRYFAEWDNLKLYPGSGAYHGVDMHDVFGDSEDVTGLPPSVNQKKMTRLMQRVWFAFADDPARGLEREMGWPRFDARKKTLALLGVENVPEARFAYPSVYDAPCSTVTMGALGTPAR